MRAFAAISGAILAFGVVGALPFGAASHAAGVRDDIAACAAIAADGARLACFDRIAASATQETSALSATATAALKQEFRFSSGLMTGPFTFHLPVSGDLKISRPTAAAREVENVVRRISKALADSDNWDITVTVHGAQITLSRGNPYSGAELLAQSETGMARTGLPAARYTVVQGANAAPTLWDDGRIRSVNEHIIVEVTEVGAAATR